MEKTFLAISYDGKVGDISPDGYERKKYAIHTKDRVLKTFDTQEGLRIFLDILGMRMGKPYRKNLNYHYFILYHKLLEGKTFVLESNFRRK